MYDCEHVHEAEAGKDSAKQFILQLEDYWNPRFLMNLRDAITDRLAKEDYSRDTRFASLCPTCFMKENDLCSNSFHVTKRGSSKPGPA